MTVQFTYINIIEATEKKVLTLKSREMNPQIMHIIMQSRCYRELLELLDLDNWWFETNQKK